jgi:hypothetical protein
MTQAARSPKDIPIDPNQDAGSAKMPELFVLKQEVVNLPNSCCNQQMCGA